MSPKANKWGSIAGAWIGVACGVIAWLVTTSTLNNGVLSIETTFGDYPMLAGEYQSAPVLYNLLIELTFKGNLASLGMGAIITVGTSYIWPEEYVDHCLQGFQR